MGLYGVGELTAVAILAEPGDPRRFSSARQAVRYADSMSRSTQSDQRRAAGHLSRQGPPALRWALYEAAQAPRRPGSPDRAYYDQAAAFGQPGLPRDAGSRKTDVCALFAMIAVAVLVALSACGADDVTAGTRAITTAFSLYGGSSNEVVSSPAATTTGTASTTASALDESALNKVRDALSECRAATDVGVVVDYAEDGGARLPEMLTLATPRHRPTGHSRERGRSAR
jgi:Transposase IS116/IS110/IS902 family